MADTVTTDGKNVVGYIIGVGLLVLTVFAVTYAASTGWKKGATA